jgi:Icc-related predicted phosphoesterase
MKFYYCSDLHLDNYYFSTRIGNYYPTALLNDINKDFKESVLLIAGDLAEKKYMDNHIQLLKKICKKFKFVLFVEGNHENYEWNMSNEYNYSKIAKNFIHLNNEAFEIENIVIYGGTLWCNLNELSSLDKFNISQMISDFRIININDTDKMSIEYMTNLYNKFIEGLIETQLKVDNENKQLIILSHFAPSIKSVTPGYENSALNPYFCNNLDDLIKSSNIHTLVHGHVHSSHDYMINNTKILCNPRGYPRELNDTFELKSFIV